MNLNRRESFAIGELALFVSAWILALVATLNDYRSHGNDVAKSGGASMVNELPAGEILD